MLYTSCNGTFLIPRLTSQPELVMLHLATCHDVMFRYITITHPDKVKSRVLTICELMAYTVGKVLEQSLSVRS